MSFKTTKVVSAMKDKGFVENPGKHPTLRYYVNGRKTSIATHYSPQYAIVSEKNIKFMAQQVNLSIQEFKKLVQCPLTKEQYLQMMLELCYVKLDEPVIKKGSKNSTSGKANNKNK